MSKNRLLFSICILFLANFSTLRAENVIKGTVTDGVDGTPLPGVQITVDGSQQFVLTDNTGAFEINITKDSCKLTCNYMSYEPLTKSYVFNKKKQEISTHIKLSRIATQLNETVVQASKYETNAEKSTNSIVVLSPKAVENKNITTADALVSKAGGVAVVDNEPQIRGGSGFSSGMGSRVMILLDNMPLLRPDAGRPMWNFIPMEDVEQVEILKGAASVVFGSSALTGAINVLTAYPRSKPKTKVMVYAGMYSNPDKTYRTSWTHHNPIKYGASFLHSRIIKKNFDFVIGGELFNDQGYIGPEERISDSRNRLNSSDKGKFEQRARFNFATRYRFKKVKGLSISLNGNAMYCNNAQSFFWFDADTNMYRTYKGSMSKFKDFTFYVDPVIQYLSPKGSSHALRNRITYSNNEESTGAQTAKSFLVFNEYQYNKKIDKIGMNIVAGVMNMYAKSFGPVFDGDNYNDASDTSANTVADSKKSDNFAFYAQIEQKFLKNRNLTLAIGGRWEFYQLDKTYENKPIFRAGINYQIPQSRTAFRASFGQGYRYPSIGEKYIAISVGRYGFYPNPELVSESSWNFEVGIMQPFKIGEAFQGMADIAFYTQDFNNYIEFCMGPWGTQGNAAERFGFKFLNTGPARITGIDFNLAGEGKIANNVTYSIIASYTYSRPVVKDRNKIYYQNGNENYNFLTTASDTGRSILKYRIEHMAKLDFEVQFYKKVSIGIAATYYSAMKNVDKFFFDYDIQNPNLSSRRVRQLAAMGDLPFCGYYNYFNSADYQNGSVVFDAHISCKIKDVTLSFIVKNLFNKSYTLRPMYVEAPRTCTFQLVYNIN